MLRSMTGFGSAAGTVGGVEYSIEARTVNNRYFKANLKLPDSWTSIEADVEKLLRSRLQRGTVTLSVRMRVPDEKAAYRVNTAALGAYLEQLKPLELDANPLLRVDLGALMQLPGVCQPPDMESVVEQTRDGLIELIGEALANLMAMREREGAELRDDLLGHCAAIESLLSGIANRAPEVVKGYHERLQNRVQELLSEGKIELDQENLAREVAIYAERSDIAEEVNRLQGHIGAFRKAANAKEPAGRKLDFIAQEMLREANTIGSKSNDTEIASAVVDIKTSIDRIKEQCQNAE